MTSRYRTPKVAEEEETKEESQQQHHQVGAPPSTPADATAKKKHEEEEEEGATLLVKALTYVLEYSLGFLWTSSKWLLTYFRWQVMAAIFTFMVPPWLYYFVGGWFSRKLTVLPLMPFCRKGWVVLLVRRLLRRKKSWAGPGMPSPRRASGGEC
jgi:hypothetical protein